MIRFIKKYSILIFLVVLVLILVFLRFFYKDTSENTSVLLTPTPIKTETPTPTLHEIDDPKLEKNETTVLPYKGKKMQIAGYSKPGVLVVLIKKEEDKAMAEIEFKQWLEKYPFFKSNSVEYEISEKLN